MMTAPPREVLARIARVAHDVNRAYCQAIGDTSQPEWDDAPDWMHAASIDGVRAMLANPDSTPEDTHKRWVAHKIHNGWTYSEKKNPECKTHPCICAYWDLPLEQRVKDRLFTQVVTSMREYAP